MMTAVDKKRENLKRKLLSPDYLEKQLKRTTGPRITALILKRGKQREKKNPNAKSMPPILLKLKNINENEVEIPIMEKGFDGHYTISKSIEYPFKTLAPFEEFWLSVFECNTNVVENCLVTLNNTRVTIYNDIPSISGTVSVAQERSIETLKTLPLEMFLLPKLEDIGKQTGILIPFDIKDYKESIDAFMFGYLDQREEIYVNNKKISEEKKKGAYINVSRGYPITVVQFNEQILVNVKFYETHLEKYGIASVETWSVLAPYLMESTVGVLSVYIELEQTRGLDYNYPSEVIHRNNGDLDRPHAYALQTVANDLVLDLPSTLKRAGFKVSVDFVQRCFRNESFLESDFSVDNYLNKIKETTDVINLHEYTGKLSPFLGLRADGAPIYEFYAVVDYSGVDINSRSIIEIQQFSDQEQRDKILEEKVMIQFNTIQIFAIKVL